MKTTRVFAIALALGVAFTPALASASTTPTTYTKSFAGYYLPEKITGGPVQLNLNLPDLTTLAKVTNGVTAEFRLISPSGEIDLQYGANPQTTSAYTSKVDVTGFTASIRAQGTYCNSIAVHVPPGTQTWDIAIRQYGYNGDDTVIQWWSDIVNGGNAGYFCEIDLSSVPTFTKEAFVDAFNAKTFKAPTSPVALASFSQVTVDEYPPGSNPAGEPLAYWPHGKYVATSTGTASGTKRAVPSAIDSSGSGFTVTIP